MNGADVKARFAPSPTGVLHLGNVRTALFNSLYTRQQGGTFLLRFEDTDLERSAAAFEPVMQEDLRWLGLTWQEGPEVGGDHGPYRQSERLEIYARYFSMLEDNHCVYPCFCSPEELRLARKSQLAAGAAPRYSGRCARLSTEAVQVKLRQGLRPTLRFRVPPERTVVFTDLVRGQQCFESGDIGDFVIRRSDGTPAFFFSNAVDDSLMGVTHVIRGEDHLANTPRQILLLEALNLRVPRYGHTSMLVGDDGAPLSKRHASRSVVELRAEGYLPQAIVNYLARLGHHYAQEGWMSMESLASGFDLANLGRAPAHYEDRQLLHWQKEAVLNSSDAQLWEWISSRTYADGRFIEEYVSEAEAHSFMHTVRDNVTFPMDAFAWARRLFGTLDAYSADARRVARAAGVGFFRAAIGCLESPPEDFAGYTKAVSRAAGVKGKSLFLPLRVALTGETHGPEMVRIWDLLGHQRVRQRLETAAAVAQGRAE